MRQGALDYRRRLVARAEGRVVELGIGSGLNLPFYGPEVTAVVGLDPLAPLMAKARASAARSRVRVTLIEGSTEAMPIEDHSVDTVLSTLTLCSILQVERAVAEARRVLRPGGQLLFVEHGRRLMRA